MNPKRILSVLLALMLLLGLASSVSAQEETVTLKLFYSAPNAYENWTWGADPTTARITELSGIALNVTFANTSNHEEFYAMLASDAISQPDANGQ